ncbi:ABSCISIC ACID-INSENSITIVE 5-like protein 7 [Citrus sinensis]|uniref:BZIP domain-containing protein n=2 Tax=Citrus TaxID=2706 RepID=A0A067EX59_CITSI|nr:bZIP transcription factor TRAB1 isoform X1 [Citrus x clementina]XP_006487112.2 bZIP transcription factor 23 isoform X1 [Citrus sinensis]ESR36253.1 hypothetical protein CICLE_v10028435mg [Citrus x clementina]KAH9656020.1 ABSCISIC ACID-INSENSITIVE 5-like protein 7 [Citrus sinensis]KDO59709.1 hypothetical protein CISIN_1g013197mg [Citrus sinensis]
MGSQMNYKNVGDTSYGDGKQAGNFPLARQPSVYSLTFEEFQNTWGGLGKDFGSMNMDELLKNIWTAEESHAMNSSAGAAGESNAPGGNLQRQGSLTLPRTLSQKTVDEVWRDLMKEGSGGAAAGGGGGSNVPQRQQTLGEMTLEEFLVRAGVVREDAQQIGGSLNNAGFYANNNTSLALGFQQPSRNNGLIGNRIMEDGSSVPSQPPSLALNVNGIRSSQQPQQQPQQHQYQLQQQQQPQLQQHPYQQQQRQQQQAPLFPKQATVAFASPMNLVNTTQLSSPGARGQVVTVTNSSMNGNLVQAGGLQGGGMGMVGLGAGGVTLATGSQVAQVSPDMIAKSTADVSSPSPVPYVFGRGRKSGALEKVVERRHRRMIKNRESAARSRARKQAYTLELEAEVAKLKELNQELERKQAEKIEMEKNKQIIEKMKYRWGGKILCLRRTLTGPW